MSAPMPIYLELVERLATPTALAFMIRAKLRGAKFKPIAYVMIRNERFVAEIKFEEPIGPEAQDAIIAMLGVVPEREAA